MGRACVEEHLTPTSHQTAKMAEQDDPPYVNGDIMLIVEDGVQPLSNASQALFIADTTRMLHSQRLNNKNQSSSAAIDLLLLGHCSTIAEKVSRNHRHAICPFAYALTRRAAAKLVQFFDICGRRLDQQLMYFAHHGLLHIESSQYPYFTVGS